VRTKVQRWGNSLAVRIPKSFAQEVGVMDGSLVEMRLVDGGLLVEPVSVRRLSLQKLLDGVTEANLHAEVDTGSAHGSEAW